MLKLNNHMPERRALSRDDMASEVPENDLIIALGEEIDAVAAEIEDRTRWREHLVEWRRRLIEGEPKTSQ
jgi:hypothetical protein